MTATPTRWAARASALYDPAYARRYRAHDDEFLDSEPCVRFAEWLRERDASAADRRARPGLRQGGIP
jgi:hypothetical protein